MSEVVEEMDNFAMLVLGVICLSVMLLFCKLMGFLRDRIPFRVFYKGGYVYMSVKDIKAEMARLKSDSESLKDESRAVSEGHYNYEYVQKHVAMRLTQNHYHIDLLKAALEEREG